MHTYSPLTQDHGLAHNPLKALIAPRPIAWVSTLSPQGQANLAPYSFFNLINDHPYQVMIASTGQKNSLTNVEGTGEFVLNAVSQPQVQAMNLTSTAEDVDEFQFAGLAKLPSRRVQPFRVADAPWHLECKLDQIVDLPAPKGKRHAMMIGTIVQVHIADNVIQNGLIDQHALNSVARCGYHSYAMVDHLFELTRPGA